MGGDYINEDQQEKFRKKLAKWLGVSYDELEEYGEDVEVNNEGVGKGKYGYYIQFSDATSEEILHKIKRINSNNTVYFNLEELDALY